MTKPATVAKAIAGVLNEVADLGSADSTPSFYRIPFVWCDLDPHQKDSFILSDADRKGDRKPRFRVTVTKIGAA